MLTRFRFTLWPTLFTIPAVIFMLFLGTWQVQRLHWKNDLIAARSAAVAAEPTPLPATAEAARRLDFHRVFVDGRFLHDKEFYLGALSQRGNQGFQIITPLVTDDGSLVLVNRGWVPSGRKDPATRAEGQVAGRQHVEGLVRLDTAPTGWIVPTNDPKKNFWFFVDIAAMSRMAGLESVRPFYIDAGPAANPGGFPIGGQTRLSLPNDHLQYAVTWYLLAVILVVIYFVFHYRRPDPNGASDRKVGENKTA
jgi:surfeit locus 1 family protein